MTLGVCIVIFLGSLLYWNQNKEMTPPNAELLNKYPTDVSIDVVLNDPAFTEYTIQFIHYIFMIGTGFLVLITPIYAIVYGLFYSMAGEKLKRTKSGKQLLEQIDGIKHFIHDFGRLDEMSKEQVVIWDDFLVYAIVLEENQEIVKEISRFQQNDITSFLS